MRKEKVNLNIFVYGTLRTTQHNYQRHFVEHSPDRIAEDAYVLGYILDGLYPIAHLRTYICPSGFVPYAIKTNLSTRVKGNLFQFINRDRDEMNKLIKSVDRFEGHPYFYKRRLENVYYTENANSGHYERCKAYMYEYVRDTPIKYA